MGLYYEEFRVGSEILTDEHEITSEEIADFSRISGDHNPLHTDAAYARSAGFRDVIAHGPFVQSLAFGLIAATGTMEGTTVALLRVSASFLRPVFAGDRIHVQVRITKKRPTRSPDRGVLWRWADVVNQDGDVVVSLAIAVMVRRHAASA